MPPKPASTASEKKLKQQIRRRAYERHEARGRGNSQDIDNWLQAEIDIAGNATSSATA